MSSKLTFQLQLHALIIVVLILSSMLTRVVDGGILLDSDSVSDEFPTRDAVEITDVDENVIRSYARLLSSYCHEIHSIDLIIRL